MEGALQFLTELGCCFFKLFLEMTKMLYRFALSEEP